MMGLVCLVRCRVDSFWVWFVLLLVLKDLLSLFRVW